MSNPSTRTGYLDTRSRVLCQSLSTKKLVSADSCVLELQQFLSKKANYLPKEVLIMLIKGEWVVHQLSFDMKNLIRMTRGAPDLSQDNIEIESSS